MLVEEQLSESPPQSSNSPRVLHDTTSNGTEHPETEDKSPTYFIAKVRTPKGPAYLLPHNTLDLSVFASIFLDLLDSLIGHALF